MELCQRINHKEVGAIKEHHAVRFTRIFFIKAIGLALLCTSAFTIYLFFFFDISETKLVGVLLMGFLALISLIFGWIGLLH